MIPKLIKLFLLLLFLLVFLPAHVVLADTGPKPTMDFEFKQELTGEPVTITSGILYECEQPDCSDASPLEELGPQRFTCEANSCQRARLRFHVPITGSRSNSRMGRRVKAISSKRPVSNRNIR